MKSHKSHSSLKGSRKRDLDWKWDLNFGPHKLCHYKFGNFKYNADGIVAQMTLKRHDCVLSFGTIDNDIISLSGHAHFCVCSDSSYCVEFRWLQKKNGSLWKDVDNRNVMKSINANLNFFAICWGVVGVKGFNWPFQLTLAVDVFEANQSRKFLNREFDMEHYVSRWMHTSRKACPSRNNALKQRKHQRVEPIAISLLSCSDSHCRNSALREAINESLACD